MNARVRKARSCRLFKPEYGDILFGAEYFENFNSELDTEAVLLSALDVNTWKALEGLGVDVSELKKKLTYTCPYLGHQYFWAMPVALCGKIKKYYPAAEKVFNSARAGLAFDTAYINQIVIEGKPSEWPIGKITKLFMGSGYTHATLITDGNKGSKRAKIRLENNDWITVDVWVWYNK